MHRPRMSDMHHLHIARTAYLALDHEEQTVVAQPRVGPRDAEEVWVARDQYTIVGCRIGLPTRRKILPASPVHREPWIGKTADA